MRRPVLNIAIAALLAVPQAAAASEDYISPEAPWTFEGGIDYSKGLNFSCEGVVAITGPNDMADATPPFDHSDVSNLSATITLSGGGGFCHAIVFSPVPAGSISYDSTGPSTGVFTFHDVFVDAHLGSCGGDMNFMWDEATQTFDLFGALPGISGPECGFAGRLNLSSPSSGDANEAGDTDHSPSH
ncbi:hypothetical protein [Altererythrobacter sp. C41]|uniref:hypothetical protein n=1 Tax=Altererythrobacter sp. C41 TaxID=2806021 RepID=UPI0019315835|nr:hypothetical protein [Altererythrobacter sp. C41]MBM0169698.1 hypothetical protein [Altererythrobacter sp. C41]